MNIATKHFTKIYFCILVVQFVSACGESSFKQNNSGAVLPATKDAEPKVEDCVKNPSGKDCPTKALEKQVLSTMPVVFAVREPSCISCHIKIKGDFVSDFMAGTKTFVGASDYDLGFTTVGDKNHRFAGPHAIRNDLWPKLNLDGRFIIPKASIDDQNYASLLNATTPPTSLLKILTTSITMAAFQADGNISPASAKAIPLPVIDKSRDKSLPGVNELLEMSSVQIKPPTLAIMDAIFSNHAKHKVISDDSAYVATNTKMQKVSGFKLIKGVDGKSFVEAAGDIRCSGDVLIDGSFVLQDIRILGEDCRFYIRGTTFLQGVITFENTTSTVQFATSYPIYGGIKQIHRRFVMSKRSDYHDLSKVVAEAKNVGDHIKETASWWVAFDTVGGYDAPIAYNFTELESPTTGGPTTNLNNGQWVANAGVNLTSFTDCSFNGSPDSDPTWPRKPTGGKNCGIARNGHHGFRTINFERIMILTSEFQSRMHGTFKGALVAQSAGFSKGVLQYEFDYRLRGAKILPLYPESYLEIKK